MIMRERGKGYWWLVSGAAVVLAAVAGVALTARLGGTMPRAAGAVLVDEKGTGGTSSSGDAADAAAGRVKALGRLEPVSGVVAVGVRPGQRISRIMVKEGDDLKDQVVAILEGRRAAEEQLAIAEATKRAADWKRGLRKRALEVERAATDQRQGLQLDAARRSADLTKNKFATSAGMFKTFGGGLKGKELYDAEGALFQLELGQIKTELERAELEAAVGAEKKKRVVEDEELSDQSPENDVLDEQIKLAKEAIAETEVRAPQAGKVLRVLAHEGEVSQGAVLEMGDVSRMVARAEVYESDVPRIKVGDPAVVTLFDQRVSGRVSQIGSIVGRNQLASVDPRALRDLRVVMVTVAIDDASVAGRFVNMEVEVAIGAEAGAR